MEKKILLISDNHSYVGDDILKQVEWCDEVWHAGDIGSMEILNKISAAGKPCKVVFGNIDDTEMRNTISESLFWEEQGIRIWMTHIGGRPGAYAKGISEKLLALQPQVFICGHSHILRVMRDAKFHNLLYLNPGACGEHGFHKMRTALRFCIRDGKITNMEAVEFGRRGIADIG